MLTFDLSKPVEAYQRLNILLAYQTRLMEFPTDFDPEVLEAAKCFVSASIAELEADLTLEQEIATGQGDYQQAPVYETALICSVPYEQEVNKGDHQACEQI
ncbi:hypothetical protein [Paenibacillus sp. HJGM_3]|uniref:hypothetical protein n=1 Tax=Paenibacillus sp. HJGM_3 TaxID=3379816 RepID=UPI00385A0316